VAQRNSDAGAAAVELAIVLPLLLLLVMGIIYFGLAYNAKIELSGAVREGARKLALGKTVTEAQDAVEEAAPGLDGITFSVTTPCAGGLVGEATVTAVYALDYSIPFFNDGTFTVTSTGVMKCEV
jgi:Flp pilus assembly protein TadG